MAPDVDCRRLAAAPEVEVGLLAVSLGFVGSSAGGEVSKGRVASSVAASHTHRPLSSSFLCFRFRIL